MTLVLLIVGLSGCTENGGGDKFVGTWTYTGGYFYWDKLELYSDGIARLTRFGSSDQIRSGTWKVEGNTFMLAYDRLGETEYLNLSYSFPNDETLVLRGAYGTEDHIFKKS